MKSQTYPGGVVVLFILMTFGVVVAQDEDMVLQGNPVSEWIKQLRSENRGLQLRAVQVLCNAPSNLHERIMMQVIPVLRSERENDKFAAAQVLGSYGAVARPAIPDLLPMLEGTQYERNRAAAAKALGQILKDAKPDEEVEKVTQALIKAFNDPYSDVRREALRACGMIGPAAKSCIPHLAAKLTEGGVTGGAWGKDEIYLVREAAAYCVMRMGPLAKEHVDLMIAKLHQEGQKSPIWVQAPGAIGPVHENVAKNIVDKLEVPDPAMWWMLEAYDVLASFGPRAEPAVDLAARYLRECKLPGAGAIKLLRLLKSIGPAATNALPVIKSYLNIKAYNQRHGGPATAEEVAEMRKEASAAWEAITGQKPPADAEQK